MLNEDEEKKSVATIKRITAPIAIKAADKCFYDSKNKYESSFNVCPVISTDQKGRLIFIDVEDNNNRLPPELKTCLIDEFSKGDYTSLPSKTFGQPLTLKPEKRTY